MKKVLSYILALVAALGALSPAACDKKREGTFVAYVSEVTYGSALEAVRAYAEEELSHAVGENTEQEESGVFARYLGCVKSGEESVDAYALPDDAAAGATAVETYVAEMELRIVPQQSDEPQPFTQTVRLLRYGEQSYCYMVTAPETGERVAIRYMLYAAREENYRNATVDIESYTFDGQGEWTFDKAQTFAFAQNALCKTDYVSATRYAARTPGSRKEDGVTKGDTVLYVWQKGTGISMAECYFDDEDDPWGGGNGPQAYADALDACIREYVSCVAAVFPSALFVWTPTGATATQTGGGSRMTATVTIVDHVLTDYVLERAHEGEDVYGDKVRFTMHHAGATQVSVPQEAISAALLA